MEPDNWTGLDKLSMFVQVRKPGSKDGEIVAGDWDQLFISFQVVKSDVYSQSRLEKCLESTQISLLKKGYEEHDGNDFTRCAAFQRLAGLKVLK